MCLHILHENEYKFQQDGREAKASTRRKIRYRRDIGMGKTFGSLKTAAVLSVCGTLPLLLAACSTPAPIVAPEYMERPKAQVVGPQRVSTAPSQKQDSGTFPTFAKPMTAAMPQMSEDEATTMEQNLSHLAIARRNGQISEAEYKRRVAELRALSEGQKPVPTPAASQ